MSIERLMLFLEKLVIGGIAFSILLIPPSLEAKSRQGAWLRIEKKDGVVIEGELLKVSGATLLLFEKHIERDFQVNLDDIKKMDVRRKTNVLLGMVGGFGVAIGVSTVAAVAFKPKNACPGDAGVIFFGSMLISTPVAMLLGALTNGFMGDFEKKRMDGLSEEQCSALLEELTGMSREARAGYRKKSHRDIR